MNHDVEKEELHAQGIENSFAKITAKAFLNLGKEIFI